MSSAQPFDSPLITDHLQLIDYFRQGEKKPHQRGIGTEHEKFVIRRRDASMLSFEESGGFGDIFEELIERFGWNPAPLDGGNLVSVVRDGRSITLEPGGQFELSGAVIPTVFDIAAEFDEHIDELKAITGDDLYYVIWGMNPGVSPEDVPWMPKQRYRIMREYLPTRGEMAHWMMKTTCTIQANFDYCSESDAVDLIHTAVLASPIVGALFANSPIQNGDDTGYQSRRNFVWWNHTDPDRTGVPPFMYHTDWGYEDYLEYILDVPMFFIERQGELIDLSGHSFRRFIDDGYDGHRATIADFELHLSTAFPDVRLKQFVEVRSGDGGPRDAVLALPALWKGILYDATARAEVAELFSPLDEADHRALIDICYRDGIHGQSSFGPINELGTQLVAIADAGLTRLAKADDHDSEAAFLAPLKHRLKAQQSWADELRQDYQSVDGDLGALAKRWAL